MPLTTVSPGMLDTTAQYYSFKNRIINGDMRIDQRNAGASVTPVAQQYLCDRWKFGVSQAAKFTAQQNAGAVTPPAGFRNYLGVTSTSAYSVVASDLFYLAQAIEGFNASDLGWGTANAQAATLSFWVRSSLTGTFGGSLSNNGSTCYPFTYTISAANTWEQKTVTVAGPTSGTFATDNSAGILLCFSLGSGSTYSGTAGAWATSSFVASATGATSVVGTNGATFYITGVQLEKGSTATSFDYRPYGTELALCQRYLPAFGRSAAARLPAVGNTASANIGFVTISFPVSTRVPPTGISVSSASHFGFGVDGLVAPPTTSVINFSALASTNAARLDFSTATSPFAQNQVVAMDCNNVSGVILFTGCEL